MSYFEVKWTYKIIAKKLYWLTFYYNIKKRIWDYDIYLTLKTVKYISYNNF